MDWGHLLFSFQGRINRAKYWLSLIPTIALFILAGIAAALLVGSGAEWLVLAAAAIAGIWIAWAVGAKRLHDRDKSAWWLVLYYLVPGMLHGFAEDFGLEGGAEQVETGDVGAMLLLSLVAFAISIWAIIDLGILKGTQGPNRFGPDPLGAKMADASMETRRQ